MSTFLFLDVETTGLDEIKHDVWEIAYAIDDGPIDSSIVAHDMRHADPKALEINGYHDRIRKAEDQRGYISGFVFEKQLRDAASGLTLVAANPAFDQAFLKARWGMVPWHYRLFDIESYACGVLGLEKPQGLKGTTDTLRSMGYEIPEPDHSAAGDVATLRAAFNALRGEAGLAVVAA